MSDRDRQIIEALGQLRMTGTRQIERLFFTTGTPLSNARHARRTLSKLTAAGLVTRLDRRIGGVRAGSAGYIYCLDVAGQRLVSGSGPAGGKVRRPWTPSPLFVHHRLAITEVFVQLIELERTGAIELVTFQAEPDCWRPFTGPHGAVSTLKPDAFAVVATGDDEFHYFIEIDQGTESMAVITRKCATYRAFKDTGLEQRRAGLFPWVLFAVPTERRRDALARVLRRQATCDLFHVALTSEAVVTMAGGLT